MDLRILFSGSLWVLPFAFGLILVLAGGFLAFFAKRRNWTREKRMRYLRLGRTMIPILPLLGIGGTVWGLMDTLLFMSDKTGAGFNMSGVIPRFGVALNTTFWGVFFAVVALVLYETQLAQLGDRGDETIE